MRAGFVGGFEARADEHGAETEAVVGGVYGEDVEDWLGWLVVGRMGLGNGNVVCC